MATRAHDDVEIIRLETRPAISIRATVPVAELGAAMGDRLPALIGYLRERGVRAAGPPQVRYHTFGQTETDVELALPLAAPLAGAGRIVAGELLGGPAIATWHLGPYDRLGEAYARLAAWLKEHGRAAGGPAWEVYHWIDANAAGGPADGGDPATWRTRLIQPIAEAWTRAGGRRAASGATRRSSLPPRPGRRAATCRPYRSAVAAPRATCARQSATNPSPAVSMVAWAARPITGGPASKPG
jgi:effector-binding domain-containing protein